MFNVSQLGPLRINFSLFFVRRTARARIDTHLHTGSPIKRERVAVGSGNRKLKEKENPELRV